jgi:cell wall-associated NlpC family hydrolase
MACHLPNKLAASPAQLFATTCLVLAGCAGQPSVPDHSPPRASPAPPPTRVIDRGAVIAAAAEDLVGSPYRFGGAGPREFDCSGLVSYVHANAGIDVPRTAAEQFLVATPIERQALRAGDLVFFSEAGAKITHVGVYVGDGHFVHAPGNGRAVSYASLSDDYYRLNYAGGGRLY